MVAFCECGADMYICQMCGKDLCSKDYPSEWRPDITENESAGNVCPSCVKAALKRPGRITRHFRTIKCDGCGKRLLYYEGNIQIPKRELIKLCPDCFFRGGHFTTEDIVRGEGI